MRPVIRARCLTIVLRVVLSGDEKNHDRHHVMAHLKKLADVPSKVLVNVKTSLFLNVEGGMSSCDASKWEAGIWSRGFFVWA